MTTYSDTSSMKNVNVQQSNNSRMNKTQELGQCHYNKDVVEGDYNNVKEMSRT